MVATNLSIVFRYNHLYRNSSSGIFMYCMNVSKPYSHFIRSSFLQNVIFICYCCLKISEHYHVFKARTICLCAGVPSCIPAMRLEHKLNIIHLHFLGLSQTHRMTFAVFSAGDTCNAWWRDNSACVELCYDTHGK